MKPSLSFLIMCAISLVLILVAVAYYLFSKIIASSSSVNVSGTTDGADSLRKHGVTDLASKISYLSGDMTVVWPVELTQIGIDTVDCQISSGHCQVAEGECFNLQSYTGNRFKLPVDPVEGTDEKTGYALKKMATH